MESNTFYRLMDNYKQMINIAASFKNRCDFTHIAFALKGKQYLIRNLWIQLY